MKKTKLHKLKLYVMPVVASLLGIVVFQSCFSKKDDITELLVVSNIADFHQSPESVRLRVGNELFLIHYKALYSQGKIQRLFAEERGSIDSVSLENYLRDTSMQRKVGLPVQHNWYVKDEQVLIRDTIETQLEYLDLGYYLCLSPHLVIRSRQH